MLQPKQNQEVPCNCIQKNDYLMQGICRRKNALYKCIAPPTTKFQRVYTDISEDEWENRYYNYTKLFRSKHYNNETPIISYVWGIKKGI